MVTDRKDYEQFEHAMADMNKIVQPGQIFKRLDKTTGSNSNFIKVPISTK